MNKPDLISVAMASYNGEKYIAEQIESIINQTYENIEIVIADDTSSDSTISIIREFQSRYPFITLLQNEKNLGVTKTFERAATHCKGVFIAFCDQDDTWLPNKLETLVDAIGSHDAVYANSMLVDENGQSLNKPFTSMMNMQSYYTGAPFLLSNTVPGHAILARSSFLKRILPFPPNLYFDLWIGFNAAATNGIKFVDEILVNYRQHSSNAVGTRVSKNKRKKETARQQFEHKKEELVTLSKAPITDAATKQILEEMIRLFNPNWSFKRSAFFFKNFKVLLAAKQKPYYRKVLYCVKMFFKPNY